MLGADTFLYTYRTTASVRLAGRCAEAGITERHHRDHCQWVNTYFACCTEALDEIASIIPFIMPFISYHLRFRPTSPDSGPEMVCRLSCLMTTRMHSHTFTSRAGVEILQRALIFRRWHGR